MLPKHPARPLTIQIRDELMMFGTDPNHKQRAVIVRVVALDFALATEDAGLTLQMAALNVHMTIAASVPLLAFIGRELVSLPILPLGFAATLQAVALPFDGSIKALVF